MTPSAALALERIAFAHADGRRVFDDLSLELPEGARAALTGPNGAGKSTLLQLAVGLLHPESGLVRVFGTPCRSEADFMAARKDVGIVFQNSDDQLFCPTVLEDVAFGPLNQGKRPAEARAIVSETLARLDMLGYEDRITYRLSHGEKRMIALAGVLAMAPRVLLLDEPTAGLDEYHETRLMDVLAGLDMTILAATHDARFIDAFCTTQYRLDNGRIEAAMG